MNIAGQIGHNRARRQCVEPLFFQTTFARLRAVVGALVLGDFSDAAVAAVDHPAGAVIVRRVGVTLFVHMAHLDKTMVGVAVQFARRLAVADDLRHPWVAGTRRREKFLHRGGDFERQLRILAVAPSGPDLGDIAI